ncbi:MAG TPA: methyltransferase domain-containing protein [Isosphaeraceae bacterium]|nr:methyltransferase domain-containing protein [Isosphaeraceae bacterium]
MTGLKRWILPLWNGGHRMAWSISEHAEALAHRRFEPCAVCGRRSLMILRRRVVPDRLVALWGLSPQVAEALRRKESLSCVWCGAKLRARRLAQALLDVYPAGSSKSIRDWVQHESVQRLRIAEFNIIEGLHTPLTRLPNLAYSEFLENVEPGQVVHGTRCEDLTRLTYPDESFDLVLSSETLEHVPDLSRALGELFRVLRPGGRHLFTVPQIPVVRKTFARTLRQPDGSLEHRARPICHPGGDVGYPVFTEFGADFPEILSRAGFQVEILFGPVSDHDIAQVYLTRKPTRPGEEDR